MRDVFCMPSLRDIMDNKSRMNYEQLKLLVSSMSISEFTDQAQHPFLVGKELYDGELTKRGGSSPTSTMRFSASEFRQRMEEMGREDTTRSIPLPPIPSESEKGGGISHAIYLLRKKTFSAEPQNVISIGRAADNDIVVADYVVSKKHAQIVLFKGLYFIVDLSSTNGTKVNLQAIVPGMKVQLQMNYTISFGRLVFVFTHPLNVYRGLRKEILGS